MSPVALRKLRRPYIPADYWRDDSAGEEGQQGDQHSLEVSACDGRVQLWDQEEKRGASPHPIEKFRARPHSDPSKAINWCDGTPFRPLADSSKAENGAVNRRASSGLIMLRSCRSQHDRLQSRRRSFSPAAPLDLGCLKSSSSTSLTSTSSRYASQRLENPAIEEEEGKSLHNNHRIDVKLLPRDGELNRQQLTRCSVRSLPHDSFSHLRSKSTTSNHIRSHISEKARTTGSMKLQRALSRGSIDTTPNYSPERVPMTRGLSKSDPTVRAPWGVLGVLGVQYTRISPTPKAKTRRSWSLKYLFNRSDEKKRKL